jgi:hypothetical protein
VSIQENIFYNKFESWKIIQFQKSFNIIW